MRLNYLAVAIFLVFGAFPGSTLFAGEPVCHILICCRGNNEGIKFQANGQGLEAHDYGDMDQVSGILQHIKDAGINAVIVDMEFLLFIGAALPEQVKELLLK